MLLYLYFIFDSTPPGQVIWYIQYTPNYIFIARRPNRRVAWLSDDGQCSFAPQNS